MDNLQLLNLLLLGITRAAVTSDSIISSCIIQENKKQKVLTEAQLVLKMDMLEDFKMLLLVEQFPVGTGL